MPAISTDSLLFDVYQGWDGYHTSIINAVSTLAPAQLRWRPAPHMRSVGELVRHIALGRITWFVRMGAPRSAEIAARITQWETDTDGSRHVVEDAIPVTESADALVEWLTESWRMVDDVLAQWTLADLQVTFAHRWNNEDWTVSRQWVIWRIMAHDIHHGGELALMLGMQGIEAFELQALGGHITLPERA